MFSKLWLISVLACTGLLSGCLGGSSDSGTTTTNTTAATTTFPFASADVAMTANGWSKNFTIAQIGSVACSGSGTATTSPANTATTFAVTPSSTVSALSSTTTITWTWSNCTPINNALTSTNYVNPSTYASLGSVGSGYYDAYVTPPSAEPATVKIGDTGILGTENHYTDATETVANGTSQVSYTVAADTATTSIITIINTVSGSTSNSTSLSKYRLSTTGVITPLSLSISWTSGASAGTAWTLTYQ